MLAGVAPGDDRIDDAGGAVDDVEPAGGTGARRSCARRSSTGSSSLTHPVSTLFMWMPSAVVLRRARRSSSHVGRPASRQRLRGRARGGVDTAARSSRGSSARRRPSARGGAHRTSAPAPCSRGTRTRDHDGGSHDAAPADTTRARRPRSSTSDWPRITIRPTARVTRQADEHVECDRPDRVELAAPPRIPRARRASAPATPLERRSPTRRHAPVDAPARARAGSATSTTTVDPGRRVTGALPTLECFGADLDRSRRRSAARACAGRRPGHLPRAACRARSRRPGARR